MESQESPSIVNYMTSIEKKQDDFILKGKVSTDYGLITDAQVIIANEEADLFFIRLIDLDIDFETGEDQYVFDYRCHLNIQRMFNDLLKHNVVNTQLRMVLRVYFKEKNESMVVDLSNSIQLNEEAFSHIIEKKYGKTISYFSFDVNERGLIRLNISSFEKERATFLSERSMLLSLSHHFLMNHNIWVMGGLSPDEISYNTWNFFQFLQKKHPEIRSYYILSDQSPFYQEARQRYGEIILNYKSEDYISLLSRAKILMTSGPFQLFYPIPSPAFHHRIKAKKVFLPQSMLGLSNHHHSFNQAFGLSPAHFVLTQSELEAEHVNLNMGYEGNRILISGTAMLDRFLSDDRSENNKNQLFLLPHVYSGQAKASSNQLLLDFHSLVASQVFKRFIREYKLIPVLALEEPYLKDYYESFRREGIQVVPQNEESIYYNFTKAMLVITNGHPMTTTFALGGRPILYYKTKEDWQGLRSWPKLIPLGKLTHYETELLPVMEAIAKRGFIPEANYQLPTKDLIEFRDGQSNARIFEILVEQL